MSRYFFTLLLFTSPALVNADRFVLKSGGSIEGELVNGTDQSSLRYYLVQTSSGGRVTLAKTQVARVDRKSESEKAYEERLPTTLNTVEGHWEMAEWCRQNRLNRQRADHLERILKLDPNHEQARYGLGYSRVEGRWVLYDNWMREQGYVLYKGAYRLRQEVALEQAKEKYELAEKDWRKKLKMWRSWISRRRSDDAMANFRAVDDPLAAMGLSELLEDEDDRQMKKLFIEVLGRLNSGKARSALAKKVIEDESSGIRDACLDQLVASKAIDVVPYFISQLSPKVNREPKKINRAGIALGRLKDPRAIKPLIQALVTEHKEVQGSSGSGGLGPISAGFGSGAPGSFSFGNKPKTILNRSHNNDVLVGLKLITGEDHRFDKERWNEWYIEANTPKNVDLRRDD